MHITLNGEKKEVPGDITVSVLLELLKIQHQRVAVELNMEIVKKDRYAATVIKNGDTLEVVSFMGGGSAEFGITFSSCDHARRSAWKRKPF